MWLTPGAVADLLAEADWHQGEETGGLLLGYRNDGAVVISEVLGPGPCAEHGRFTFRPDADWQRQQVARIYTASGRITTYLGDWHTHPGGTTTLSRRDTRTIRGIARATAARQPQPLMAVLAFDAEPAGGELTVWELAKRWRAPQACVLRILRLGD